MSDNKRNRGGKGYYIALVLCAAAIWITGYAFYRNNNRVQEISVEETYEDVLVGTMGREDVAVIATEPQPKPAAPSVKQETTVPSTESRKTMKTVSPVSGAEIFGYSMEALSYNQTTRDWRVHNGIDLAAEDGTPILAAADGQVFSVKEDEALGHMVIIRHDEGYTTRYGSLAEEVMVKTGDRVTAGQTIGYAGDSAITENTLGSHVHFSVTRHDQPVDPAEFLSIGQ